jgi:uncharacterized membrane protein
MLEHRRLTLLAGALSGVYVVLWGTLTVLLYRTFSLHVWDVGANFVLTNLSSPPGLGYGHLTSAPQNLIYVFFIPLVKALPSPLTLPLAEDALMAVGGFFVYLVADHVWQRPGRAVLLEGLYLFSYALFGAPYFPNHYEILFSVFFPIAFYLYLRGRLGFAAVFVVLAALCSSLAAIDAGVFAAIVLWPSFLRSFRSHTAGWIQFLRNGRYFLGAGVASVAIFVLPFLTVGAATTLSYSHLAGGSQPNLWAGITFDVPTKAIYLVLLLVPFLPVLTRSRYTLLALPYVALVVLSGGNTVEQFAYQYTYTVGAILFIAYIDAVRPRYAPPPDPSAPVPPPARLPRPRFRLGASVRKNPELTQLLAFSLVLGFLILPFSPGNALAGPYASLPFQDYHLPTELSDTPYDQALWEMTTRIPASASVLLQENMPMLTARPVWYEPGSYDGEPVDYALTDPSTHWFTYTPPSFIGPYPTSMLRWVNDLYENRSYGILEEYDGAMLLEESYRGAPVSFVPFQAYNAGSAFVGKNATSVSYAGSAILVNQPKGGSLVVRTEALLVLPPGTYQLTFSLGMRSGNSSNQVGFGLYGPGATPTPFVTDTVEGSELATSGALEQFSFDFVLYHYEEDLYLGGVVTTWAGTLSLDSVYLNQTQPG